MSICKIGKAAPLFELLGVFPDGTFQKVSLQQNMEQEKWTILMFYPKDFTKICPTEITAMSDRYDEFEELDAVVIGISMDSLGIHEKWIATPRHLNGVGKLAFPLATDTYGQLSLKYNVLDEEINLPLRGLFIINPEGELQYISVLHHNVGRDVDEILRVLQALQTGGLCPANWRPGNDLIL